MNSIALVGKPNAGKSLLFNRLTGLSQKVTNFPGITVQVKQGRREDLIIYDFPGVYTFSPMTRDEEVAIEQFSKALEEKQIDKVVCLLDVNQLSSSLRIGLEIRDRAAQHGIPTVFAANMIDELDQSLDLDWQNLRKELDAPLIPISAKTGEGFNSLLDNIKASFPLHEPKESLDYFKEAAHLALTFGPKTEKLYQRQRRLDRLFLSPFFGLTAFILIMLLLFQAVFSFALPFMDGIDWLIGQIGILTTANLEEGIFKDFLVDALFGGIGSFLVFVPQIFFLTFIIGILEDSGYLARAAMLCHRPLKFFGLSGKSFIPMLTGHACAIPAVYASRMIESPRRRLMTIVIVPLMGCSARLPVYSFLIAAIIPRNTFMGGLIGLQGLALFFMYAFGIFVALSVSYILSRGQVLKSEDVPFILELPNYRLPHLKPLILRSLQSLWHFISRAGGIIFTVTVAVWVLGYFPNGGENIEASWLGQMGKLIEPLLEPIGLNWKYGIAILSSFLAREVFVGTLGTIFGIEDAETNFTGLLENVQSSGLSFSAGLGLLVFYAIALQCASTFAVLKNELGGWKGPIAILTGYTLLAYVSALLVYWIF